MQGEQAVLFIIQARDIFSSIRVPLATAWEDPRRQCFEVDLWRKANFVRIDCPKDIDSNTDLPLKPSFDTCLLCSSTRKLAPRLNSRLYNRAGNRETKVELKSA